MYFHYMFLMYITWHRIPGVTPSTFSVVADRYQPCKRWRSLLTEEKQQVSWDRMTQALDTHSVILNKRYCINQYTWILKTVLTLYGDSTIYYINNNGMNIIK